MILDSKKRFVIQARVSMDVFTEIEAESAAEAEKLIESGEALPVIYSLGFKPDVDDDDVISWCFDPIFNGDCEKPNHGISVGITNVTEA